MRAKTKSKTNPATERIRQQRLRDRRKEQGWKRITIWLNPSEAATLETLGDEWLGRTVKGLLFEAVDRKGQPQAVPAPVAVYVPPESFALELAPVSDTGTETATSGPPDIMREVDSLRALGLSGEDIARQFNAEGRRTAKGAEYRGANLLRDWRKWKGASHG